jgi:nitrate reductase gamma subunit
MFIGTLGFICLAFASTIWIFILGIAVFSIGEMTAHPKYYSYVGLIAPPDRKAVYMGYAFLYGVIGSLVGSNIGGTLYELMLKPLAGSPDAGSTIRTFWLLFAGMNVLATVALLFYNRAFSQDTPATRTRARSIMIVVYSLICVAGAWFLISTLGAATISYKTMIQAIIMMTIGGAGMMVSMKKRDG